MILIPKRMITLTTALGLCAAVLDSALPIARGIPPAQAATPVLQRLFSVPLPEVADGVPAYLPHIVTPHGTHDMLFLTTRDGRLLALDAHSGSQLWMRQHGPGACRINGGDTPCYTTSSPVVDPNSRYVYSYGLDGAVHKFVTGTGTEVTGGGWPERTTRKGADEKGSSALALATVSNDTSYLYMTNGGYPGDRGDYQGHVTTIDLRTGTQHVFNAACSDQAVHFVEQPGRPDCSHLQTAIWARQGAVYDSATNRTYVATGNGDFAPGSHTWADSVLALHPDGTGANGNPLDSYTPRNYQQLNETDADLGSAAPVILPMPKSSRYPHLGLQAGKDALLRLLNLDNLSGQGTLGKTGGEIGNVVPVPQGGTVLSVPAVWLDPGTKNVWVFVSNALGISGLRITITGGTPQLRAVWKRSEPGFSPIVAGGMLFYAGPSNFWALDPRTGNALGRDQSIGYIHWQSPRAVGNVVYIADSSAHLSAFTIPSGA